jgi:hypothetical protein
MAVLDDAGADVVDESGAAFDDRGPDGVDEPVGAVGDVGPGGAGVGARGVVVDGDLDSGAGLVERGEGLRRMSSTRRLLARPSAVEFSATGMDEPKPLAVRRSGRMPCSIRYSSTASARF